MPLPTNFMSQRMRNYIRAYRKRAGLTQDEVAILLGCQSGTKVSRLERLSRKPSLQVVFACQVLFGIPAHELFPGIYQEVEQLTVTRATKLLQNLKDLPLDPASKMRRELLRRLVIQHENRRSQTRT